jgi:hypothetical protein
VSKCRLARLPGCRSCYRGAMHKRRTAGHQHCATGITRQQQHAVFSFRCKCGSMRVSVSGFVGFQKSYPGRCVASHIPCLASDLLNARKLLSLQCFSPNPGLQLAAMDLSWDSPCRKARKACASRACELVCLQLRCSTCDDLGVAPPIKTFT